MLVKLEISGIFFRFMLLLLKLLLFDSNVNLIKIILSCIITGTKADERLKVSGQFVIIFCLNVLSTVTLVLIFMKPVV